MGKFRIPSDQGDLLHDARRASEHAVSSDWLRLTFGHDAQKLTKRECVARGAGCSCTAHNTPWFSCLLQPGGDVHRVTGDQEVPRCAVARGDDLACAHSQTNGYAIPESDILADSVPQFHRGIQGALRIVSVGLR